ncbi:MAG: carboxypeptidase-like regulatory domain-containing protein [Haloarculaceae archaeon]
MLSTKTLTVALVALLATGGAAATVGTAATAQGPNDASVHDAAVDAVLANGTVTVTVTDDGAALANATVRANEADARTDANGTATFDRAALTEDNETLDELDVSVAKDTFEARLHYRVDNGSLTLLEESYRYHQSDEEDHGADETHENGRFDQAPPEHAHEQGPPEHAMNDQAPPEHAMNDQAPPENAHDDGAEDGREREHEHHDEHHDEHEDDD